MPRPRTPAAKAQVTGAAAKDPQRHRGRKQPKPTSKLGRQPAWFDEVQASMWEGFKVEVPWLTESDRGLMEIACVLRAQLKVNPIDMGVSKINQLRMCISQMGATPADRSKVASGDDEEADPDDKFFI